MKSMRLKGIVAYDLRVGGQALGIFWLIMMAIYLVNMALTVMFVHSGVEYGGTEVAVVVFCFVIGIMCVRQDLRMFIQNGKGRPTVFIVQMIMAVAFAIGMAVANWLLLSVFRLLGSWIAPGFELVSLYEAMQGTDVGSLAGIGYTFLQCIPAFLGGMMISLIYYRLNKVGKGVFSIAAPSALFVGLPWLLKANDALREAATSLIRWFLSSFDSALSLMAVAALVFSLAFAIVSWLLLRRAPVQ